MTLRELNKEHRIATKDLEVTKEDLKVKTKAAEENALQAEGAMDALEQMRKEVDDLVDQRVAEKQDVFEKGVEELKEA